MTKFSLFKDNKIIIENYKVLKDIDLNSIVVDEYKIEGEFLKINKMDSYYILINGKINSIIIMGNN